MATEIFSKSPDCEIVTSRIINSPRELVYRAWTEPDHLKNWWGPAGFTNTFHQFDLQVGGRWSFTMHGPEKGHYVNECEFVQIERPKLIAWKRHSKPLFHVVATFNEVAPAKTEVVFKQVFDTPEECGKIRPYVMTKMKRTLTGLNKNWLK